MRLQEQVDQQPLDGHLIVADLVIARRRQLAQFHPIERRLAGHRRTILAPRLSLPASTAISRHGAVRRSRSNPHSPARSQTPAGRLSCDPVLDQVGAPHVVKARGKPIHHSDRTISRAQQQRSGIRGDRAGIERRYHFASFNGCKSKQIRATLCRHRGSPQIDEKMLQHNDFRRRSPIHSVGEKSGKRGASRSMIWTRLSALIVKELLAAFRDFRARIALIAPPIVQLFLFAFAATLEVSNVPVGVLNQDWGLASQQLISRFERAWAFSEIRQYASLKEVQAAIDRQDVLVVVHIGQDFSRKLEAGEQPDIQLLLDGRKSNSAQIVNNYIGSIIRQFGTDFRSGGNFAPTSEIVDRSWYNPNREYQAAMVPALIATLPMTMVLMIVGMSVARERELGTFEQLLVSPLQPLEIVVGKAIPGLIVGLAQCGLMTFIVTRVFGIFYY